MLKKEADLISGKAKIEASSIDEKNSVNIEMLTSQSGDEEVNVVLATANEENPFVLIDLLEETSFDAFKLLAPMDKKRAYLKTLTVWISSEGDNWKQIWQADRFHVEMARSFDQVFDQSYTCRFVKVGLQEKNSLLLKSVQLYSK